MMIAAIMTIEAVWCDIYTLPRFPTSTQSGFLSLAQTNGFLCTITQKCVSSRGCSSPRSAPAPRTSYRCAVFHHVLMLDSESPPCHGPLLMPRHPLHPLLLSRHAPARSKVLLLSLFLSLSVSLSLCLPLSLYPRSLSLFLVYGTISEFCTLSLSPAPD